MNAPRNTKLAAAAVVGAALLAAGGAYAASKHASKGAASGGLAAGTFVSSQAGVLPRFAHGGPGMGHRGGDDFAAAATYLGLTEDALRTQLQSGKTLAQVADATSGKSTSGLIDALVKHEQDELAQAVKDGNLTQAQADTMSANLKQRFTDMVNGVPGPFGHGGPGFGFGHHGGDALAAAATYLGISQDALLTQLQGGKTLAQVAGATSGKSTSGLIDALVKHEQDELAQAVKDGNLTQAQAETMSANLKQRVTDLVNGVRPARPDGDRGHWGGPPPAGPYGFRGTHI